jgi:hypothetical protein
VPRADSHHLLARLTAAPTAARAASCRPLDPRGHGVEVEISRNQLAMERA